MSTLPSKKKEKVEKYESHTPFDLAVKTEEQARELVTHLKNMKATAGWQLMVQILEGNMATLEQMIITKQHPETGGFFSEVQLDEMRSKRNYLAELVGKPDELIKRFEENKSPQMPEYDPYHTDARQIGKESESVGTLTDT